MAMRKTVTLVATVAQTVTLAGRADSVEVCSLGSAPVYWRMDGTIAVAKADDCFCVQAGSSDVQETIEVDGSISVSVISASDQDCHVALRNTES